MKKSILIVAAALSIGLLTNNVFAQTQPTTPVSTAPPTQTAPVAVPAAKADSVKDIDATIANVADLSSLTADIKAANLDASLKTAGPFTVFAPDNAAFSALPKTTLDSLAKDPIKLATLVNAHVVAGTYDKKGIIKALTNATRTATLKTVDGQTLTIAVVNKKVQIKDAHGNTAEITSFDTPATNGVIHGVNGVLMAK
ncbi:fasciclin domain-containing protein [Mucilaginibacter flavidus]|uniref:fasciclin domain-containing protein n=1 Tax=Mucilaginibacter flavidus TaxID=2949309 RepID=UPI002093B679|nr:fasciclin domain-containing protein [Mucilaginibacter flavidus]MCO5946935.1 fasciclin domain-containing protein [Mucilaginibacter flavidus]